METIEKLRARQANIIEKNKQKRESEFQEILAKIIIYYCSNGGKDYLPTDEKLFLTAIVCGLMDILGIEDMEICPYLFSKEWKDDIGEALICVKEKVESNDFKEPFHGWRSLCFSIKKILNLEYCDNDDLLIGGGEYKSYLMTIFRDIRGASGYSGKSFKISQEAREYIEKEIIPNLSPNFANLAPNLSVIYFVQILAEKAKKYLKKELRKKLILI